MSILIKGMEMPKSCKECQVSFGFGNDGYCPFLFEPCDAVEDGLMWKECPKEGRLADCPLVEVKEPHGRLIDKDKLRRELFWNFNGERIPFYDCDNFPTTLTYRYLHSILSEQPTIIEAEVEE